MRYTNQVVIFLAIFTTCLVVSDVVWDAYLPGRIYNCTDFNTGFLMPGNWVHGNYVIVPKINPHDSMSQPDSIEQGWNLEKLWLLWVLFIFVSAAISASFTFPFFHRRKKITS